MSSFQAFGLFAVFYIAVVCRVFLSHGRYSRGVLIPGPFVISFVAELGIMFTSAMLVTLVFGVSDFYFLNGVNNDILVYGAIVVMYSVSAFCFTFLKLERHYPSMPEVLEVDSEQRAYVLPIVVASMMVICGAAILCYQHGGFPIFADNVGKARAAALTHHEGLTYAIPIVRESSNFIFIYIGILLGLGYRINVWVAIALMVAVFGQVWWGAKAPLALAAVMLIATRDVVRSSQGVSGVRAISSILLKISIPVALVVLMYLVTGRLNSVVDIEKLFARIAVAQYAGFFQSLALYIPDLGYAKSWLPLASFWFEDVSSFSRDVMLITERYTQGRGLKNSFFAGEIYVVFGVCGVLLAPVFVAIVLQFSLQLIKRFFSRYLPYPAVLALLFLTVYGFRFTGGASNIVLGRYLVPVIFIGCVILLVEKIGCRFRRTTDSFGTHESV